MRLKKRWGSVAGALMAASLCAYAIGAHAATKVRLGKAQALAWTFIPADVGVDEGIFARYGLDVSIIAFAGDAKVQQALAADSIDFALASGPAMAFSVKGSPVIAVAAYAGAPRNISTLVITPSPIKTVADLKGKMIGVSTRGSLTDWLAQQMSLQQGWGQHGVRIVPLGSITASIAALKAHEIDASVLATEVGYQLEARHEGRIIVGMDKYAPNFITHVIFARDAIVKSNPDLVERFLKGFFASIAYMKAHPATTDKIAEKVLGESPAVARETYKYEISMLETDGTFDPKAVEVLKKSFVQMGTLPKVPSDTQLFTTRFVPVKP